MSHHSGVATITHSLAPSPPRPGGGGPGREGCGGRGFQGASVCSVSAVIVKQQVEAGALLRYSQKAVREESA